MGSVNLVLKTGRLIDLGQKEEYSIFLLGPFWTTKITDKSFDSHPSHPPTQPFM